MPAFHPSARHSSGFQALMNRPFVMAGKAQPAVSTPNASDPNPTQAMSAC
jgi:hypothetical protein